MLTDLNRAYIIERLIETVAALERPRETLTAPFINTTLPLELRSGLPRELVHEAVRLCVIDGWNHNPTWLSLLLQLVPQDPKIVEITQSMLVKPPSPPDPLLSTILHTGAPFVGREELREQLRRLATDEAIAQPIFVVNGSTQSGKSYSAGYIEHFSYNHKKIITYPIEFKAELGMGAEQVARDLVAMMGRPSTGIPKEETNKKLYVRQLASWVLFEATQAPDNHWFIFDNFRDAAIRQDTRDFLIAIADLITKGLFPHRCRLILTGFDRELLTVEPEKVEEEIIKPCPDDQIVASIHEILQRAPKPVNETRAVQLLMIPPANGELRMQEINLRLRALLEAIRGVQKILKQCPAADFEAVLLTVLQDLPSGSGKLKELRNRLQELKESAAEV